MSEVSMVLSRKMLLVLTIVLLPLSLGWLFIQECAFGGGMGATDKSCDCLGYEQQLYDYTPSDGPRKSVCIGVIRATECYQYMGGPVQECDFATKVTAKTDKLTYELGENIELQITNSLSSPIRYYGSCSIHLCQDQEGEWYCEIEDCFAPVIEIQAGSSFSVTELVNGLVDGRYKYRFEYQTFGDDTLYTIESNQFTFHQE